MLKIGEKLIMENINIWDTNQKDNFDFYNNIDEFIRKIENNEIDTSNLFLIGENDDYKIDSHLKEIAKKKNLQITFVDTKHPICISKIVAFSDSYMSKDIFLKNKERIVKAIWDQQLNEEYCATIHDYSFDESFLDRLLEKRIDIDFINTNLTEEQKEKIRKSYITAHQQKDDVKEKICDKNLVGIYTKEDLETINNIVIDSNISDKEIKNLKFLSKEAIIHISPSPSKKEDWSNLTNKLEKINSLGRKYTIQIDIKNRKNFKSELPKLKNLSNIEINLSYDLQEYSLDEYIKEEETLDNLIKDIKNSNLSPFEKYIEVYNIVKKYKEYKENPEDLKQSRYLKYILDNDYMVCVGYAKLLEVLLEKIGIESCEYSTTIFEAETENNMNKDVDLKGGHARLLVNIKDDKYNIDGYYIADPTWDNNHLEGDTYTHMLLTHDSMQKAKEMFSLTGKDLIFDVHNMNEFVDKINTFLKMEMRSSWNFHKEDFKKNLNYSYHIVYLEIMDTFERLDKEQYKKLEKYEKVNILDRDEAFYKKFLTEVGKYIVSKTNKEISNKVIIDAITNVKTRNWQDDKTFVDAYKDSLKRQQTTLRNRSFPYEITPDKKDQENVFDNNLELKNMLNEIEKPKENTQMKKY